MPQIVDLMVENGFVITMDDERRLIKNGTVVVAQDRIIDIGPAGEMAGRYQAARRIDASEKAVLPGLIDAHGHGGHSLIKTVGSHLSGLGWRTMADHIYFRSTGPEYWYADGLVSALERLKFGTTFGMSILGSVPRADRPEPAERYADGAAELGIRTAVAIGPARPPFPRKFSWWEDGKKSDYTVTMAHTFAVVGQVVKSRQGLGGGLIHIFMSPSRYLAPSPFDPIVRAEHTQDAYEQSRLMERTVREFGLKIHTPAVGGAIAFARRELSPALLGPHVSLGHCFGISAEEVRILADTGTSMVYCPTARRVYSDPARTPVPEAIEAGVNVAIGSDGSAPDRTFDLFKDLRAAMTLQRYQFKDGAILPEGKALEMVTCDAARALGVQDELGSLAAGKKADIITVNLMAPHMVPHFMVPYRVVYEAGGHDVMDVVVNGRLLMADRKVLTVDENRVLRLAQEQGELAVERSGMAQLISELPARFWSHSRL